MRFAAWFNLKAINACKNSEGVAGQRVRTFSHELQPYKSEREKKTTTSQNKLVIYEQIILDFETRRGLFTFARITRRFSLSASLPFFFSNFCKSHIIYWKNAFSNGDFIKEKVVLHSKGKVCAVTYNSEHGFLLVSLFQVKNFHHVFHHRSRKTRIIPMKSVNFSRIRRRGRWLKACNYSQFKV